MNGPVDWELAYENQVANLSPDFVFPLSERKETAEFEERYRQQENAYKVAIKQFRDNFFYMMEQEYFNGDFGKRKDAICRIVREAVESIGRCRGYDMMALVYPSIVDVVRKVHDVFSSADRS